MIDLIFTFVNEVILVKIDGSNVQFGNTSYGNKLATIDGLKLDYVGTIREFPDLETDENWKTKAIERFKEKIKSFRTEDEIADYIIEELKKFGYKPHSKQKAGFRPVKLI